MKAQLTMNTAVQAISALTALATVKKVIPQVELDNRCKAIGTIIGRLPASMRSDLGIALEASKALFMANEKAAGA